MASSSQLIHTAPIERVDSSTRRNAASATPSRRSTRSRLRAVATTRTPCAAHLTGAKPLPRRRRRVQARRRRSVPCAARMTTTARHPRAARRAASPTKPFFEQDAYTAWDESGGGVAADRLSAASCAAVHFSASGCCSLFDASAAAFDGSAGDRRPRRRAAQLGATAPAAKDESSLEDVGRLVGAPRVPRRAAVVRPARATDTEGGPVARPDGGGGGGGSDGGTGGGGGAHTSSTASLDERLALSGRGDDG